MPVVDWGALLFFSCSTHKRTHGAHSITAYRTGVSVKLLMTTTRRDVCFRVTSAPYLITFNFHKITETPITSTHIFKYPYDTRNCFPYPTPKENPFLSILLFFI